MATGTPATALLARENVTHALHPYPHDPRADSYGAEAATALGVEPGRLFKTLIASIDRHLVCAVVPVSARRTASTTVIFLPFVYFREPAR